MKARIWKWLLGLAIILLSSFAGCGTVTNKSGFSQCKQLPDLPDFLGVAGAFAGVSNGALIVAGGANFPEPLFKNDQVNPNAIKTWRDDIYVLASPDGKWFRAGSLARPLGYGASVTTSEGLICIGGSNADSHYSDVFILRYAGGKISRTNLPSLPEPCANMAAVFLDGRIYVLAGQCKPSDTIARKNFWTLSLPDIHSGWQNLAPWPGPARILPVAAVAESSIYMFSGSELNSATDGKAVRKYLTDGYKYTPDTKGGAWEQIAPLPVPVTGAPTPAPFKDGLIFVFGGDHGKYAEKTFELKDKHPGFSRDILAYDIRTNTWTNEGILPAGHVTATVVKWNNMIIIPSGEIRPGTRTPKVLVVMSAE